MFLAPRINFESLANVCPHMGGSGAYWHSESDDPQLLVRPEGLDRLRAGWYQLTIDISAAPGSILAPCLYVDYGEGWSEATRIPLLFDGNAGTITAIIALPRDAVRLRFDPTIRQADFSIGKASLRRIGRFRACIEMLKVVTPSSRMFNPLTAGLAKLLVRRGLRAAGGRLRGQYLNVLKATTGGYAAWVAQFDSYGSSDLLTLRESVDRMVNKPLISVLMPTYNTQEHWLRKALDSVLAQVYPHWELCIADDASSQPHVRRVLSEYARRDNRIRVAFRESNGHISAASNSALEMARGEFVALLDHDDEIPPHALFEIASAANLNPDWQLIYSDEDKLDELGRRFDPYFKPDWNYDLLLGQNFICHLSAYRTRLVREVGGFRLGFEGSQDWDLALRVSERLTSEQIGHIPKVLYHWRAIQGSTAVGVGEKNYAVEAGRKAVQEHLSRIGQAATVGAQPNGHLRIRYALPSSPPMVSLIVPTRDKVELLRMCVDSILGRTDYPNYEILIVDNQSSMPETLAYFDDLQSESRVRILRYDAPFNYSDINNHAATFARGEVIGLINNDIEVISPDWLQEMVGHALRPSVGAVGAMLYYPDDRIQHAGVVVGLGGVAGHAYVGQARGFPGHCSRALVAQEMSAVTAACLLVRKNVFAEVGGLDPDLKVAFNDIDLCLRIRRAGYRNIWTPFAELYHHESASRGHEDTPEKQERFQREISFMQARWGQALLEDPAYNINLSLDTNQFDFAFPPRTAVSAKVIHHSQNQPTSVGAL